MVKLIIHCICGKNFESPLVAENHKKKHPSHLQTYEGTFEVIGDFWPVGALAKTDIKDYVDIEKQFKEFKI